MLQFNVEDMVSVGILKISEDKSLEFIFLLNIEERVTKVIKEARKIRYAFYVLLYDFQVATSNVMILIYS